jgi:CRP/FNR family transcriptional regulator, cyclic AMP receptor protein
MDKQEAGEIARRRGWLSATPVEFQDRLLARCDLLNFKTTGPIYRADDDASGIFGIVRGCVELHYPGHGEGPTLGYIGGPGLWLGDSAAVDGRVRRITLIARTGCWLLRLSRADLHRLTTLDPLAWRHLAELLAQSEFRMLDIIDALRRSDPVERVAAMLCSLTSDLPGEELLVQASQSDLAAVTRLGRNAVNLALGELEARQCIRRGYGVVEVTDQAALHRFVWGE